MKKLPIFLLLLLVSNFVFASSCGSTLCTGNITNLYPHGDTEKISIQIDTDTSGLSCTLAEGKFIVLTKDNKLHSEIYSMLLSAAIAGKTLTFRMDPDSSNCSLTYVQLRP